MSQALFKSAIEWHAVTLPNRVVISYLLGKFARYNIVKMYRLENNTQREDDR